MKPFPLFLLALGGCLCLGPGSVRGESGSEPPGPPSGFDSSPYPLRCDPGAIASDSGLFRLEPGPEIYRHSGAGFGRLRLANDSGGTIVEMPFVIRPVHVPPVAAGPRRLAHRVESLVESPDGAIELVVVLDRDAPAPARIEIETPLRDFEKGVSVSVPGSDGAWSALLPDGVIFDHSRFLDFRRTFLTLPPTEARRFRVRIGEATEEQRSLVRRITRTVSDAAGVTVSESGQVTTRNFRINELRFLSAPAAAAPDPPGRHSHALGIREQATSPENDTRLLIDGGFLPLDRMTFETQDHNFRRRVSVQVSESGETWRTIARGHIHQYEVGGFREASLVLAIPETRAERYRILVENGKNPPVSFTAVGGEGPAYEFVFAAARGDRPVLFLGGDPDGPDKPQLDTAAIDAALRTGVKPETLPPGSAAPNPDYRRQRAPSTRPLDSPAVLWTIIAVAVAVLIRVLYGAFRKIEEGGGG